MRVLAALLPVILCLLGCAGDDDDAAVDGGTDAAWSEETLFSEDFEQYADRSNLSGQGGWTGGQMLVGERLTLASSVAAGQLDPGTLERSVLIHELPSFERHGILRLDLRAYAYTNLPLSDKSGVFLSTGTGADVGWLASKGAGLVWRFDCRNLTGNVFDFEDVFGGYGEPVSLAVVIDFTLGEAYGISDFGDGPRESARVGLTAEQAQSLRTVLIVQDYKTPLETLGADFDDLQVSRLGPPAAD